ncbi:hypothetical protein ELI_1384 [Eubacterium callanderi]|uniref:Uncharacterized protein n=1 Tax=Eubacterium callanderi TaxID=53442 RepID=E3GL79_9FIRM|nr:hypothetical protein ELI_1384 [Eubacterium callanderi]
MKAAVWHLSDSGFYLKSLKEKVFLWGIDRMRKRGYNKSRIQGSIN